MRQFLIAIAIALASLPTATAAATTVDNEGAVNSVIYCPTRYEEKDEILLGLRQRVQFECESAGTALRRVIVATPEGSPIVVESQFERSQCAVVRIEGKLGGCLEAFYARKESDRYAQL